jgi:hypothetical protein
MKATINEVKFTQNGPITICKISAEINFNNMPEYCDIISTYCFSNKEFERKFPYIIPSYRGGVYIKALGKSRLHEEDTNSIVGKRLAESRAKEKIFKQCNKLAKYLAFKLSQNLAKFEQQALRYQAMECREIFHQKELKNYEQKD